MKTARLLKVATGIISLAVGGAYCAFAAASPNTQPTATIIKDPPAVLQPAESVVAPQITPDSDTPTEPDTPPEDTPENPVTDPTPEPTPPITQPVRILSGCGQLDTICITVQETN